MRSARSAVVLAALALGISATPAVSQLQPLCPIHLNPIIDNVDLESATSGDTTWISIPISGSNEGANAESSSGDSYVRSHAQLISQPARFIIQLDQRVVAGTSGETNTSNGLVSVVLNVSGIDAQSSPVELTIDTFRTITPNAKSIGWVAFNDSYRFVGDRPWQEHKQETIKLDSNQTLPPLVIEAFLETVGKCGVDVTTTMVVTPRSCGGGGAGELPINYLPDCLFDDPGPWPSTGNWKDFDNSDDCGGAGTGGSAFAGGSGGGPSNGPDVWNSTGPGLHADVATGDVFTTVPIFAVQGEDPSNLRFELRYNSICKDRASPLGPGWTHNFNRYLAYERTANSIQTGRMVLYDGVGRRHGFRFIEFEECCADSCNGEVCGYDEFGNSKCCCIAMCLFRVYERPFGRDFDLGPANTSNGALFASFPNGEKWEFAGPASRISRVIDPRGGSAIFAYANGKLETITDKFERTATFEYYADSGLLHKIHHPDSLVTTLSYENGRLATVTDPENKTTSFQYNDSLNRLTRETLKNGTIWNCAYQDTNPAQRTITDSAGNQIVRIKSTGFPLVPTANRPVDSVTLEDGKGRTWQYQRDLWGRITGWTTPESQHTRSFDYHTTYNGGGQAVYYPYYLADTGTEIGTRNYARNDRGKATSIKDAYNHETEQRFSHLSRESLITARRSPRGLWRTFDYDEIGNVHIISDWLNEEDHIDRTFDYTWHGGTGCLKSRVYTDADGRQTKNEYDSSGRLVRRTLGFGTADAAVTEFENDTMGRRTMEKVHRDATTTIQTKFVYDGMGRLTDRYDDWTGANPSANHTQYEYDGHGLLLRITNPRGVKTSFHYDLRNRVDLITEDEGGKNYETHVQYDGNDNVWKFTDALNRVSIFEYDGEDNLVRSIDAGGYETLLGRNAAGQVTSINRQRSLTSSERDFRTIVYDLLQRPLYMRVAPSTNVEALTTIDYDGVPNCGCSPATPGRPLIHKIIDPTQKVSYRYYDELDRLVKVVRKVADTADNGGDADDAITHIDYDLEGNITGITGPEGEHVEYVRDAAANVRAIRAIGDTSTGDLSKTLTYDGSGNIKSISLPNGNVIQLTYDGLDRLETATDSIGSVGEIGYDDNGNVTTWTDGRGVSRHFAYDTLDRLEKVFDADAPAPPSGPHTEIGYDAVGNRKWIVDKLNKRTEFTYDSLDRLTQTTEDATASPPPASDTANTHTTIAYDGASRTTSLIDHDGNETKYTYDAAGGLLSTSYPNGGTDVVQTRFNKAGDLEWRKDQRGIETTYGYNDLHQLRARTYRTTAGAVIRGEEFGHDRSGRLKQADQLGGMLVATTYDVLGRRETETLTFPGNPTDDYTTTFNYIVGPAGSTRTVHYPHGRAVVETRDKRGRLGGLTSSANSVAAAWDHDLADRRFGAHLGGVINSTFAFDDLNRLTRLTHAKGGAVVEALIDLEYGYDLVGNRTFTRDHLRTNQSETYVNDPRDRLRKMERGALNTAGTNIDTPLVDAVRPARQDWTLDRRGNWGQTQEIRNGWTAPAQTRQADVKNEYTLLSQIIAPPDGVWNQVPEYDLAGNLLFEPRSPLSGNSTGDVDSLRYAYDEENRLIEVRRDQDNALLAQYAYDALGRRVQTLDYTASATSPCINTSSPLMTRHLMAGLQTLEETIRCTTNPGGSGDLLVREFVWGDRFPEPVAMVTHGSVAGPSAPAATSVYYYLPDILGSVLALADAAGNVVERYSYDPYGRTAIERHETSGAWTPTPASSFGNPFAWTGQRYDAPVRLYHFLFRSYSPTLGRWLQRDPAGYVDGVNLYEGVRSSPIRLADPLGLDSLDPRQLGDAGGTQGANRRDPMDDEIADLMNRSMKTRKCSNRGYVPDKAQQAGLDLTMGDLREALAAFGDGALKTAIIADHISDVFFVKALVKELATLGVKIVIKGGKKLFLKDGKELAEKEAIKLLKQAAGEIEEHHLLPQAKEFTEFFRRADLNIEDYTIYLQKAEHRLKPDGIHTGTENWNKVWKQFKNDNPYATKEQILEQLKKMIDDFKLLE